VELGEILADNIESELEAGEARELSHDGSTTA